MFLEKNYLMIGNTRWHWATKIQENWKYFHTSPNPIEFKYQDFSKLQEFRTSVACAAVAQSCLLYLVISNVSNGWFSHRVGK